MRPVGLMPGQRRPDDVVDAGTAGDPAEFAFCLVGQRDQTARIAGTARTVAARDLAVGRALHCGDDFGDAGAAPGAEVVGSRRGAVLQRIQCAKVGFGEIFDVDVIADRSAVRRVEIVAEDREFIAFVIGAERRL